MRSFIIVANRPIPFFEDRLTKTLDHHDANWWHWFPDAWLFLDPKDRTAIWWRDTLSASTYPVEFLVLEMQRKDWAGSLPAAAAKWLHHHWSVDN